MGRLARNSEQKARRAPAPVARSASPEQHSHRHEHGREDIGVCFCGAPMIAAALKETCEKLSNKDATVFRLHKENF